MTASKTVRVAAITTSLDWSHRTRTSGEKFDARVATAYIRQHVALSLRLMDEAALLGAELIVGPEYFAGSELFTTDLEHKREIVHPVDVDPTVRELRRLSARRGVYLACAMDLTHSDRHAQTGVLVGRSGELIGTQVKNTCIDREGRTRHEYRLFDLDVGTAGIFTCSDLNTFPEDGIDAAKRGMELVLVPGAGFGPPQHLTTKAMDLGCVLIHADGGRGMIVAPDGTILAKKHVPDAIVYADVRVPSRDPTDRLRWGVN